MTKVSDVYPDKWLRVADLAGKRVVVTVVRATVEDLRQIDGGMKRKVVLALKGTEKRLPLNKTQALAVAKVVGREEIETWAGIRLALRPGRAQNGKDTIMVEGAISNIQNQKSEEGK